MEVITHEALRRIVEAGKPPCVSIFMPTHRTGRDVRQDPIVLKDLLKKAEQDLQERGTDKKVWQELLAPVWDLVHDEQAWPRSENGLAFFLCPGFSNRFKLPIEVEDVAYVNDHFYVKPVLPLLDRKEFYLIAISQGAVRLLHCLGHGWRLVELPEDMAKSIKEAVLPGGDDHPTTTVRRAGSPTNPYSRGSATGGEAQDLHHKLYEDLMFYLRQVDEGIRRVMDVHNIPVVLAGDESIRSFYRKASELKTIYEAEIHGNPEHVSNEQLADQARGLLEPLWQKELHTLQERYGDGTAQGLSSHDPWAIVEAAQKGAIDTLFVPVGAKDFAHDPAEMSVTVTPDRRKVENDVLNQAAIYTLLSSGRIVPVLREEVPGNHELAAIFRYPVAQAVA